MFYHREVVFMHKEKKAVPAGKPRYTKPDVVSEPIFERRALACGKCRTGPHRQQACMRLCSVS
jgi:hypothetical protein